MGHIPTSLCGWSLKQSSQHPVPRANHFFQAITNGRGSLVNTDWRIETMMYSFATVTYLLGLVWLWFCSVSKTYLLEVCRSFRELMYFRYHYPEWSTYRPHPGVWTDSKKLDTWDERIRLFSSLLHWLCKSTLAVTEHSASLYGTLTASIRSSAWFTPSRFFLSCYCSWILKSFKIDTVDWNLFAMEYFWWLFLRTFKITKIQYLYSNSYCKGRPTLETN